MLGTANVDAGRVMAFMSGPKVFGAHDVGTTRRGLDTAINDRARLQMKQRRRRHASQRSAVLAALLRLF